MNGSQDAFAPPSGVAMSPAPTEAEAVAIVAAMEALWPRPVVAAPDEPARRSSDWRFSGRWWNKPIVRRRVRP